MKKETEENGRLSPFEFINDVTHLKRHILTEENVRDYNPYLTNLAMSGTADTVLYAQQMNEAHHLDKDMQYEFYFHSVAPKKRWTPWLKKQKEAEVAACMKYFGYGVGKAKLAVKVLTDSQVKDIMALVAEGGVEEKKK